MIDKMLFAFIVALSFCITSTHSLDYDTAFQSRFGAGAKIAVTTYSEDLNSHWARLPQDINEDNYHFTVNNIFDKFVKDYQDSGVVPFGILNPRANATWLDADSFAQAVSFYVERYDGDGIDDMEGLEYPIMVWEFFNEFSTNEGTLGYEGFTEDSFVLMMKAAVIAAKEACASCSIAYNPFDTEVTQKMLASVGADSIDIISFHTYKPLDNAIGSNSPFYTPNYPALLQTIGLYGKEVWATEYAMYENPGITPHEAIATQGDNARYFIQTTVYGYGEGIFDKIIFTEIEAPQENSINLNWMAFTDTEGNKREIYYAFKKLAEQIDYFDTRTSVDLGNDIYAYRFGIKNRSVLIAWSKDGTGPKDNILINDLSGDTLIITSSVPDNSGNFDSYAVNIANGSASITVTDTPLIIIERYQVDLNGSGLVDLQDILIMNNSFGATNTDGNWNAECDFVTTGASAGRIDFEDILYLAEKYGSTGK